MERGSLWEGGGGGHKSGDWGMHTPHIIKVILLTTSNKRVPQSCAECTCTCGTRPRFSFSGGLHTPVNMADVGVSSWTVSGSKEAMEVPKNLQGFAKTWHTKYSTVQHRKHAISCIFPPTFTSSILSAMFTGACGPPEKLNPHFGATLVRSAHDCETRL